MAISQRLYQGPGAKVAAFGACAAVAGEEVTASVKLATDTETTRRLPEKTSRWWRMVPRTYLPNDRLVADVRSGRMALRAIFPRSGSYTVPTVDGIPIASSPLILHVFPGACETTELSSR